MWVSQELYTLKDTPVGYRHPKEVKTLLLQNVVKQRQHNNGERRDWSLVFAVHKTYYDEEVSVYS